MKLLPVWLVVIFLAHFSVKVCASTRYVDVNGKTPVSPYLSWGTAATNIQDAIDVAGDSDLVLVTNGIYSTGGRVVYGQETNRIVLTNSITLLSVNGPWTTVIVGGTQTRGAYVSSNAVLNGFTIASGRADVSNGDIIKEQGGGGIWCETGGAVSNCIIRNNFALHNGGGIYGGTVYNSTLMTNQSNFGYGGGAAAAVLFNSTLTSNTAPTGSGGGAYRCLLSNCTVTANYAYSSGGGVFDCTNYRCVLDGNSNFYRDSGGADYSTLYNCVLTRNSAGADDCTLYDCTVADNSAYTVAGGAIASTLYNCTVVHNSTVNGIGGTYDCLAYNSIIYFNSGPTAANWDAGRFTNCCTFPMHAGAGNFTNAPGLVDVLGGNLRLQIGSRCIDAGNNAFAPAGTDLDGNPRIFSDTVDLGPYENRFSDLARVHFVSLSSTNPVPPYTNWPTAATNLQDAVSAAQDGEIVIVDEGVYAVGGTVFFGTELNRVALTNGISLLGMSGAMGTAIVGGNMTRCVYVGSNAVLSGFTITNGNTSYGGTIYETSGGGIWCEPGGVVSNCNVRNNSAFRYGAGIYGGTVYDSTLTWNFTDNSGGGAYASTLNHCSVSNNSAFLGGGICLGVVNNSLIVSNRASSGGGACSNSLKNCVIRNNLADSKGGGAYNSALINCTVVSNQASGFAIQPSGGGVHGGTLTNCVVYFNTALNGSNFLNTIAVNCCTLPLPAGGVGNITNEPAFVNLAAGDLHLLSTSPCINSGNSAFVTDTIDFDGNPRIVGGTVDIGAYEFQSPGSILSYAWAQQYGLLTDGSADYLDSDGDGMNNWQEWQAGTVPIDATSVLEMVAPNVSVSGVTVTWQSVSGKSYFIQRSSDLSTPASFSTLQGNIPGQVGTTTYNDTTTSGPGPFFYRVGVQ